MTSNNMTEKKEFSRANWVGEKESPSTSTGEENGNISKILFSDFRSSNKCSCF